MISLLLAACHVPEPDSSSAEGLYGEILSQTLIGGVADMVAGGNAVFVCLEDGGLQVYDISDPADPDPGNLYYSGEPCQELDLIGSRLFAGTSEAFRSYSPNNMLVRGEFFTDYAVQAMTIEPGEDLAWLAGMDEHTPVLEKLEYREDADMYSLDRITLSGQRPVAIASRPEALIIADSDGTVQVLSPDLEELASWQPTSPPERVSMSMGESDYVYLSLGSAGVAILDARVPADIHQVGAWQEAETWGVLVLDDTLYVGIEDGVVVLDITTKDTPAATGAEPITVGGSPARIWIDSGFGYTIDAEDGILTIFNAE